MNRRTFLTLAGGLSVLPTVDGLAKPSVTNKEKKVVYIFLDGGMSQFETFHDTSNGVDKCKSTIGVQETNVNGIRISKPWIELSKRANDFSFVRSFTHTDADHSRAKCVMQTGALPTPQGDAQKPSVGAVVSKFLGGNALNGLPLYVRNGKTQFDSAVWLGSMYNPFDADGDAKKNFMPLTEAQRLAERGSMLERLDRFQKDQQRVKDLDNLKKQAFSIILGECREAFATEIEPQNVKDAYGKGVGEQFLLARRLLQYGARFLQINNGGWDMHQNIANSINNKVPNLDRVLGVFIDDLKRTGLFDDTLIVITGDFGRTKENANNGRDHWSKLTPLIIGGANYARGQIIGSCDKNNLEPTESPFKPQDLTHTICNHFGIPKNIQYTNHQGRPIYILENSKLIL